MEPTDLEKAAILDLDTLFSWAGVSDAALGQAPLVSVRESLLAFLGVGPNEHYRALAMMSTASFDAVITTWLVNAVAATPMQQATASRDFERCIRLRDKIKSLKVADLTEQMNAASVAMEFETCIRLRSEIAALQ